MLKAPQIGATLLNTIKSFYVAKKKGRDIIYTLPTSADINDMAGGKVNRIIAQNQILKTWVKDHDTVEQKTVGANIIYYRGTWTNKQAMMVSSRLNIHDEVDASKQDIIEQYETRLQAEADGWRWYFSHPSVEGAGVDKYWQQSDQKHWFITCGACKKEQYLDWPDSIDKERRVYQCKHCKAEITDDMRRNGYWKKKYLDRPFSGYWIPQLICPWIPATKILDDFKEKTEEYFYNFTLGKPYVGGGNKITQDHLWRNLTSTINSQKGYIVIGLDTGKKLNYVIGNNEGLFYYGECADYDQIEKFLNTWPKSILVVDEGGDIIGPRKLREKYPGRVFLCHYAKDRKTQQLIRWGVNDEDGHVTADRNRTLQMMADHFRDKRIPLQGTQTDWYEYWLHLNNMYRTKEENNLGVMEYKWERSGPDHWAHATNYYLIGMDKFGGESGGVISTDKFELPSSFELNYEGKGSLPHHSKLFQFESRESTDWRT